MLSFFTMAVSQNGSHLAHVILTTILRHVHNLKLIYWLTYYKHCKFQDHDLNITYNPLRR